MTKLQRLYNAEKVEVFFNGHKIEGFTDVEYIVRRIEFDVSYVPCECGADKIKCKVHSDWCPARKR